MHVSLQIDLRNLYDIRPWLINWIYGNVSVHEIQKACALVYETMEIQIQFCVAYCLWSPLHFDKQYVQWNLSIADMLYSGHLSIADTIHEIGWNHGHSLIGKPHYSGIK